MHYTAHTHTRKYIHICVVWLHQLRVCDALSLTCEMHLLPERAYNIYKFLCTTLKMRFCAAICRFVSLSLSLFIQVREAAYNVMYYATTTTTMRGAHLYYILSALKCARVSVPPPPRISLAAAENSSRSAVITLADFTFIAVEGMRCCCCCESKYSTSQPASTQLDARNKV